MVVSPSEGDPITVDPLIVCADKLEQIQESTKLDLLRTAAGGYEGGIIINPWEPEAGYVYTIVKMSEDDPQLRYSVGEFTVNEEEVLGTVLINHRFCVVLADGRVLDYPTQSDETYYQLEEGNKFTPFVPHPNAVRAEFYSGLFMGRDMKGVDIQSFFGRLSVSVTTEIGA